MHVCVVGGGIVGLASAWQLARQGARVTLVERNAAVGQEASYANGGQLSYDYVAPLADAGVLAKVPGWVLDPHGPLRFVPRAAPSFWAWCLQFVARCNRPDSRLTTAALIELGRLSQAEVARFACACDTAAQAHYRTNGKLVVYRDAASFAGARERMRFQATLGSRQSALDAADCVALEPALDTLARRIVGGIHTPGEAVVDGHALARALAAQLALRDGVDVLLGVEVRGFEAGGARIRALHTDAGPLVADAYVVAAGVASRALLAGVGVHVPLAPLKGYSLTLPIGPQHRPPWLSITDAGNKIVLARLGERLRIAGMVDLGDGSAQLVRRRVAALLRQAQRDFPAVGDFAAAQAWAGLRPATPSGRPIIDRTRYPNLWTNLGHGALGLTLAMGSGRLLAERLLRQTSPIDAAPYALAPA